MRRAAGAGPAGAGGGGGDDTGRAGPGPARGATMDSSAPGPPRRRGRLGLAPGERRERAGGLGRARRAGWWDPAGTPGRGRERRGEQRRGGEARRAAPSPPAPALWGLEGSGCRPLCSVAVSCRQPWALVGVLGGDRLSTAEDKREYHGNGTTGLAVAQRDFLTYDGTRFTVTAFSGWIKGLVFPDDCLPSVALLRFLRLLAIWQRSDNKTAVFCSRGR